MKKVVGSNVKVTTDSTGGFISVDWECPYCEEYHAGFYFSSKEDILKGDFEIDKECERCNRIVTIECRDSGILFGETSFNVEDKVMRKYHVISAKRMGNDNGDRTYEYVFFPTDEYSKEDAMSQFCPVQKETLKNNSWYPYTAYEYDGETFYSIEYSGIADESEI